VNGQEADLHIRTVSIVVMVTWWCHYKFENWKKICS